MSFKDEMDSRQNAHSTEEEAIQMDIAANNLNAQEVVFEVEKTLNQACDYLDSGSGYIVLYDPPSTPKR